MMPLHEQYELMQTLSGCASAATPSKWAIGHTIECQATFFFGRFFGGSWLIQRRKGVKGVRVLCSNSTCRRHALVPWEAVNAPGDGRFISERLLW
jgi:hypothetical protein